MNQKEALKRLETLETQARVAQLEQSRHDPEFRAQAAEIAARSGFDVDEVITESLEIAQRAEEIGEGAWDAECLAADREQAERMGISLERYQSIDWQAEHSAWVAEGSIPGAWIGRDWDAWPARLVTPS
jgi:hypothetical protein